MKNNEIYGPCERFIQEMSERPKRRIWSYRETFTGNNSSVVSLCYDEKEHKKSVNDLDKIIDRYYKRKEVHYANTQQSPSSAKSDSS